MRNKTLMIFMTILFIAGSIPMNNSATGSSNLVAELQGMEIVQQDTPSAINNDGYFSVWNNGPNQVHPNQSLSIDFFVDNWFDTIKHVEISVWAEYYNTGYTWQLTPGMNETLYPYDTYYITHNFTASFNFPYEGEYSIFVKILDLNDGYEETFSFWYEAWNGWFNIWVYQGYEGRVNQSLPVSLEIENTFEDMRQVRIDVIVWQYTENETFSWEVSSEIINVNSSIYSGYQWYHTSVTFTEIGHFEIEYQLTDISSGRVWYQWCYWEIYGYDYVDVIIHQDNYGYTDQYTYVTVEIANLYTFTKNFSITVEIVDDGFTYTIESSTFLVYTFENGSFIHYFYFDLIFDTVGYKYIHVYVTELDTMIEHYEECWWLIEDYFEYYGFYLWIEQEYSAYTDDEIYMGLHYESNFNESRNVRIELFIDNYPFYNHSLYYEDRSVGAYEQGLIDIYFNISTPGYYEVMYVIYDYIGGYTYYAYCYWDIYEKDDLDIWIEQDFYIKVDEQAHMKLVVNNKETYDKTVSIEFFVSGGYLGSNYSVEYGEFWIASSSHSYFDYYFTFAYTGYYDVYFVVYDFDTGLYFYVYCWWEVSERPVDTFELKVHQDYNAKIGEVVFMDLEISNYYNTTREIKIDFNMKKDSWNNYQTIENREYWVSPTEVDLWDLVTFEYTFGEVGYYDIEFVVTDLLTDNIYVIYCYWNVYDDNQEGFNINIYQDFNIAVDDEAYMEVVVKSSFNHSMNFDGYLYIQEENGDEYSIWHTYDYIDTNSEMRFNIYHTFTEAGHYEVIFELVDDIGASWYAYCYWDVSGDTGTDPTDSSPPVLAGFSWAVYLGALAIVVIPVSIRKRKNY
ncbi:MAG: hypothetical protein ACTSYA_01455 [Candidatus Kariarchaeaceae archaeon]